MRGRCAVTPQPHLVLHALCAKPLHGGRARAVHVYKGKHSQHEQLAFKQLKLDMMCKLQY